MVVLPLGPATITPHGTAAAAMARPISATAPALMVFQEPTRGEPRREGGARCSTRRTCASHDDAGQHGYCPGAGNDPIKRGTFARHKSSDGAGSSFQAKRSEPDPQPAEGGKRRTDADEARIGRGGHARQRRRGHVAEDAEGGVFAVGQVLDERKQLDIVGDLVSGVEVDDVIAAELRILVRLVAEEVLVAG